MSVFIHDRDESLDSPDDIPENTPPPSRVPGVEAQRVLDIIHDGTTIRSRTRSRIALQELQKRAFEAAPEWKKAYETYVGWVRKVIPADVWTRMSEVERYRNTGSDVVIMHPSIGKEFTYPRKNIADLDFVHMEGTSYGLLDLWTAMFLNWALSFSRKRLFQQRLVVCWSEYMLTPADLAKYNVIIALVKADNIYHYSSYKDDDKLAADSDKKHNAGHEFTAVFYNLKKLNPTSPVAKKATWYCIINDPSGYVDHSTASDALQFSRDRTNSAYMRWRRATASANFKLFNDMGIDIRANPSVAHSNIYDECQLWSIYFAFYFALDDNKIASPRIPPMEAMPFQFFLGKLIDAFSSLIPGMRYDPPNEGRGSLLNQSEGMSDLKYGGACPGAGCIGGRIFKLPKLADIRPQVIGGPASIAPWLRNRSVIKGGKRLLKGSKEAKAHMAYLRSLRGKKRGSGAVGDALQWGVNNWVDWGKAYKNERDAQIAEIQRLEKLRDERRKKLKGKGGFGDVMNNSTAGNVLRGPAGWIRLIGRTARQNKINALKKELGLA